MVLGRLKCGKCAEIVKEEDGVVLDELNGIVHIVCFAGWSFLEKDRGYFYEIIDKYDFFRSE